MNVRYFAELHDCKLKAIRRDGVTATAVVSELVVSCSKGIGDNNFDEWSYSGTLRLAGVLEWTAEKAEGWVVETEGLPSLVELECLADGTLSRRLDCRRIRLTFSDGAALTCRCEAIEFRHLVRDGYQGEWKGALWDESSIGKVAFLGESGS